MKNIFRCISSWLLYLRCVNDGDTPVLHYNMTSLNENIFRVAVPLWGESNGHRWTPLTKASVAVLWCFVSPAPEQRLSKQSRRRRFETASNSLWRHSNEIINLYFLPFLDTYKAEEVFFSIHGEPWYRPRYHQLSSIPSVLEGLGKVRGSNIHVSSASIPIWLIAHLGLILLSRLHTRNLVSSLSCFMVLLALRVMVMITNIFSAIQIYGLPQFITFDCK